MTPAPVPSARAYATILLATDLTPVSAAATEHAIELAAQLSARLLVVNVIDPRRGGLLRPLGRVRPVEEREDRTMAAQDVVDRARQAGARATYLVWDGDPGDGILAAAEAEGADLIVVGTRGRGAVGRMLGSVSDRVLHRAQVPVLVVRPDGDDGDDVADATDGADAARPTDSTD
jgi:nucleotide-binding universal stress UspA family protein